MSFADLGLNEQLVQAINECGYTTPTPIQTQAIPLVLKGGDLLAGAQTGTGKTAGFGLPMLQRLSETQAKPLANGRSPVRALVLTPTRELAAQVEENIRAYAKHSNLRTLAMFGGVSINPQMKALGGKIDIVVATPGRLLDHVSQRSIDLSRVEMLVLDEADRMLDMGFIHDIRKVLAKVPPKRQNLLFSATFSKEITALATTLLDNPASVEIERHKTASEQVTQELYFVDKARKRELLSRLMEREDWQQVLVFCRTKHGANRLTEYLNEKGILASAIHGNKSQGARTRALAEFKSGNLRVLVATDIAARGIDIEELPFVVNFDLPSVPADYVHRIGRTGRAAATGKAVSLVCIDEHKLLKDIEKLLKAEIPRMVIDGFEPDPSIKAEPIENGCNNRGGRRPSSRKNSAKAGDTKPKGDAPQKRQSKNNKPQNAGGSANQGQSNGSKNKPAVTNVKRREAVKHRENSHNDQPKRRQRRSKNRAND